MYRIGTIAVAIVAVCFAGAAWAEDEAACPASDFDHCVALGKTWPECGVCLDTNGKPLPPPADARRRAHISAGRPPAMVPDGPLGPYAGRPVSRGADAAVNHGGFVALRMPRAWAPPTASAAGLGFLSPTIPGGEAEWLAGRTGPDAAVVAAPATSVSTCGCRKVSGPTRLGRGRVASAVVLVHSSVCQASSAGWTPRRLRHCPPTGRSNVMYRIGTITVAIAVVCLAGATWAEDEATCPASDFDHCVALGKTWPECGVCLDTKGKTAPAPAKVR